LTGWPGFADGTDWILNDDLEAIEHFMALLRAMRKRARQRAHEQAKPTVGI